MDTDRIVAWAALLLLWALPLLHVALSRRAGPWRPPEGSGCPIGPRWGWLVMVLLTGAIGWLLMVARRRRGR
ncbi:MAG: hypothetical protein JNK11_15830 [Alphaproteobacteria bacterium]|nr:hypothetical protein [Alphaproteobacteria bacterium]